MSKQKYKIELTCQQVQVILDALADRALNPTCTGQEHAQMNRITAKLYDITRKK